MKSHRLFVPQSMIPALLSGAKTQHRVLLSKQPPDDETLEAGIYRPTLVRKDGEEYPGPATFGCFTSDGDWALPCPYQPGDEVWCGETWMTESNGKDVWIRHKDGSCGLALDCLGRISHADAVKFGDPVNGPYWRSPATMPRWAARIFRTVKAVRVERVQDVSEADAVAESARYIIDRAIGNNWCSREAFAHYWDRTHGPGAWDRNDWVWVLDFEEAK